MLSDRNKRKINLVHPRNRRLQNLKIICILGNLLDLSFSIIIIKSTMIRINIGCGITIIPGWQNLDNSLSVRIAKFPCFIGY